MTPLSAITGLSAETADLLAAAGVRTAGQLAREDPATLHRRLELIAWQRGRASRPPDAEQVEHFVAAARIMTPPGEEEPLNVDELPEAVGEEIAQYLPAEVWIPPSRRAAQAASGVSRSATDPENVRQQSAAAENMWRKVDPNRFATIEAYNEGRSGVEPLSRDAQKKESENEDDREGKEMSRRAQRIRSKGEELSPWVRRGVVHSRPFHTWCGALVSLLWRLALAASIVLFIVLITQVQKPSKYMFEVVAGFLALLVLGAMQLHFASRSRCRVCSCNLFHSKNCLKNRKAHHVPGLGYVASLSLHLLIFGWFRCMYCGTAIRLKPGRPKRITED